MTGVYSVIGQALRYSMKPPHRLATAALAATLCCACGEPLPISVSALREDEGDTALVDEAVGILGMEWELSRKARGTIHLTLVDADPSDIDFLGLTPLNGPRCFRTAVVRRNAVSIAHELGHLLGLDHVCEMPCPDSAGENLMRGDIDAGTELSEDQLETIDKERRRITHCR